MKKAVSASREQRNGSDGSAKSHGSKRISAWSIAPMFSLSGMVSNIVAAPAIKVA